MEEKCPVCGSDQTNKGWFIGRRLPDGMYQAVCFNCRVDNMHMADISGHKKHRNDGPAPIEDRTKHHE